MALQRIQDLAPAAALDGSELIELEQGGASVQCTAQDIADLAGGGIPDAPSDGKQYAREDGGWSEVQGVTAAEIAEYEQRLEAVEAGQGAAMIGYATKAQMDANLAYPDGTLALVTNDPAPANNGTYRKAGASGSGSWVLSADRVTGLEQSVIALENQFSGSAEEARPGAAAPLPALPVRYQKFFVDGQTFALPLYAWLEPSAFSGAKAAISAGARDVNIVVAGDSTGDAVGEWVFLFAQWLAVEYPSHSVSYRLFDNGSSTYAAETVVATGSGPRTVRIWNASIGGTAPATLMVTAKLNAAFVAPAPDLVIWNYGHNLTSTNPAFITSLDSAYSPWMERVQAAVPLASHAILTQNPNRDDNLYAPRYEMIKDMAQAKPGLLLIDSYEKFIAAGKSPTLYTDNIHPSQAGSQLYADAVATAWRDTGAGAAVAAERWLATAGSNLLANGRFESWDAALPANWSANGTATVSKDTGITDAAPYSLRLVQTGASAAHINQLLTPAALAEAKAAGSISVAFRRYLPAGSAASCGGIFLEVTAGSVVNRQLYTLNTKPDENWHWMFLRNVAVPENTTSIRLYCYADLTSTVGATVHIGRVVMVTGATPRDML